MNTKIRIKAKIDGYYFLRHPGLIWHSGKFWVDEIETKIIYNNGSKAVLYFGKKLGVKKLRKQAIKIQIEILDNCPF